ncbi:MAG: nitrite/sulfite reductase [Lachnospiraceae bacterium]
MEQNILKEFEADLEEFQKITEQFYNREITVPQYKAASGGYGSYAQRGGERSMLRLRLPGGEIDKDKLKFIVDSIEKYQIDLVHLTTCQTIQLHNLTKEQVCALAREAFEHGIITRGGGGDYPRNVMCPPLSGVEAGEYFDVLPYAKEVSEYLLSMIHEIKLPRKLKVAFSNGLGNETHATFRDLGFVAEKNHTFQVYAAGGLGHKPKIGVLVAENIEPYKVLYCVKTMIDVFTQYGNYENRAAARSRFLQDTLSVEGFREIFQETLADNLKQGGMDIVVEEAEKEIGLDTDKETAREKEAAEGGTEKDVEQVIQESNFMENPRVIKQKQEGWYAVSYHPPGGKPEPYFFTKLYELIYDFQKATIRLTPDQGLYVINLTKKEAEKILEFTPEDMGTVFERSTACIGADVCQVGIGKSQQLLEACLERVKKENFKNDVLPAIHISGCPASCGTHQTAALGFRGGKKPTKNGPEFAFAVYENGSEKLGEEQFGRDLGIMLERDIPEFLVELGRAIDKENLTFQEFQKKYPDRITEIAKPYVE